jgi:hypothetical protein
MGIQAPYDRRGEGEGDKCGLSCDGCHVGTRNRRVDAKIEVL